MSYIVEKDGKATLQDERPKQEDFKTQGLGTYILRRTDGTMLKVIHVVENRNGNPKVLSENPVELAGISTLNLRRLLSQYAKITKVWPAKTSDARKIENEMKARQALVEQVAS